MDINRIKISKLELHDFNKCQNIWDMNSNPKLKKEFYDQLKNGSRITFVCENENNEFLAEGSLVFDVPDGYSTITNKRINLSHLEVKPEYRSQGIGSKLCEYIFDYCRKNGYTEITLSVLLANYNALRLYHKLEFDRIIAVQEDDDGKHLVILKKL